MEMRKTKIAMIVSALALLAIGFIAETQAQAGGTCISTRSGNSVITRCY
jgi:hypothetical protein